MKLFEKLSRFVAGRKRTVVFPLDGKLVAIAVQDGKELASYSVPLLENLSDSFRALREKGMKARRLVLLVNGPSLQWERKKFPDMTDEEFEETMYWEGDRLFAGDELMVMSYRVLSHSAEGYDILFHGVPKDELTGWETAACEAGLHLETALPVTDIRISDDPYLSLYVGKKSAALFFYAPEGVESRQLTLSSEGKAARFLAHMFETDRGAMPCFLLPFSDAAAEDMDAWRGFLLEEMESLPVVKGNVEIIELSEAPLRSGALLLSLSFARAGAPFPLTMAGAHLTKENRAFRIAQGLCLAGFLFFLFAWGHYFYNSYKLGLAQEGNRVLVPVRESLRAAREKEAEEEALLDRLKDLEKKSPHWEEKLLALSDAMPQGIVLKSIRREGDHILIEGTAIAGEPLQTFTQALARQWGGRASLKSRKMNQDTELLEFTVEWRGEE